MRIYKMYMSSTSKEEDSWSVDLTRFEKSINLWLARWIDGTPLRIEDCLNCAATGNHLEFGVDDGVLETYRVEADSDSERRLIEAFQAFRDALERLS